MKYLDVGDGVPRKVRELYVSDLPDGSLQVHHVPKALMRETRGMCSTEHCQQTIDEAKAKGMEDKVKSLDEDEELELRVQKMLCIETEDGTLVQSLSAPKKE